MTGGTGGWSEVVRPRRVSAAEWTGTSARTQVLPLILDGMEAAPGVDLSIEQAIAALTAWGQKHPATGQPPILGVSGPIMATDGRWVINDLTWDTQVRNGAGNRIQQRLTLTLLEFLEPTLLASPAAKARKHKHK